jgi:hypothetical protein
LCVVRCAFSKSFTVAKLCCFITFPLPRLSLDQYHDLGIHRYPGDLFSVSLENSVETRQKKIQMAPFSMPKIADKTWPFFENPPRMDWTSRKVARSCGSSLWLEAKLQDSALNPRRH